MSIPKDLIDYFPNVSNKFMNKFWNKLPIDDTKAMLLTGVCKLSKKEKEVIKKNIHTSQFFCNYKDIHICKDVIVSDDKSYIFDTHSIDCPLENVAYFNTYINLPLHTKKSHSYIEKKRIMSNYYNDNLQRNLIWYTPTFKYEEQKQQPTSVIHWGQLKLLLSEIEFFTQYIPKNKDVYVIYAGAAAGSHIYILSLLFPRIYFYLVDPNPFDSILKKMKRVYFNNGLFTDKLAKKLHNKLKGKLVYFISDIRSGFEKVFEEDVNNNMKQQMRWHKILKPEYSMLKLRFPYNKTGPYEYFDGKIFFQAFAPTISSETRLIVPKKYKLKKYNIQHYEAIMYYFNRVTRSQYYKHTYNNIKGMDHCYDCSSTFHIINEYKKKYPESILKKKSMKKIISILTKDILGKYKKYNKFLPEQHNISGTIYKIV